MTDRSPSVTSEAWQKALDCAYSIMEDYFAKPHISTEAGRKKALDEAMQHAFGCCLSVLPNEPLIAADLSPENKNRSAGNGMLAKIAGRNVTGQVMKN
jgi:hypothetical protein